MNRTSKIGRWAMIPFAVVVGAGLTIAGTAAKPTLDGKVFEIQLMKGDAKTGDADTLTFASGKFDSLACHKYGFGATVYSAMNEGAKVVFVVRAKSQTDDKQLWNGTVEGNKIHGTMKLTDDKGAVTHYRFQGQSRKS